MPPPAGGGGGNQEDGGTNLLWAVAAIFIIFGVMWYIYKIQIISSYLTLKTWELDVLKVFVRSTNIADLYDLLVTVNPEELEFGNLISIGKLVGNYVRIPCVVILLILATIIYYSNTTRKFKNTYSMQNLVAKEQFNWPQIMPVINKKILQQQLDTGVWAMAMTPIQFAKKYNLIELFQRQSNDVVNKKTIFEIVVKRGEANKIFALQLGPRWQGVNNLPPYTQALFAVFAARINADTKVGMNLLMQLNRSSGGKLNCAGSIELCTKYQNSKLVKAIVDNHAYVLTVMASMLVGCRQDGVQATADFLWLKPQDRSLWYMLNNIGRQTAFIEVAGPYAHWLAEKEAGHKLIMPMVETASDALELAMKSIVYNPQDD